MKSITIHNIDDSIMALLRERANREGRSINQTIKRLVEVALGVKKEEQGPYRSEFEKLCGLWTKEEQQDFEGAIKDLEKINKEEWK